MSPITLGYRRVGVTVNKVIGPVYHDVGNQIFVPDV